MANTAVGNPYVESSDLVANYPGVSETLAERIDVVGVNPFADAAARTTAIPSPVEGQMSSLADTDSVERYDGSAWVAVGTDPGLVLVNATTFTSVTSINLDSIFTSDYLNYRIIWQGLSASGSALNTRLRVSGADNTASEYDVTSVYGGTGIGSPATTQPSAQTSWQLNVGTSTYNTIVADILSPNIATPTLINATSLQTNGAGNRYLVNSTQVHRASTAFDGYNVFLDQSTTGTVRVYGYSDGA